MVGITKKPRRLIATLAKLNIFDGMAPKTISDDRKEPVTINFNERSNQWYFSIIIGKIIELISPDTMKIAPRILVSVAVYPKGSNKKLMIVPKLT